MTQKNRETKPDYKPRFMINFDLRDTEIVAEFASREAYVQTDPSTDDKSALLQSESSVENTQTPEDKPNRNVGENPKDRR